MDVLCFVISQMVDELGNIHGRSDGANATAPALLMGSHLVRSGVLFWGFVSSQKSQTLVDLNCDHHTACR